jgi:hypothetical protein
VLFQRQPWFKSFWINSPLGVWRRHRKNIYFLNEASIMLSALYVLFHCLNHILRELLTSLVEKKEAQRGYLTYPCPHSWQLKFGFPSVSSKPTRAPFSSIGFS